MKRQIKKRVKAYAIFQILLMFSLTFAISIFMSEMVSAATAGFDSSGNVVLNTDLMNPKIGNTPTRFVDAPDWVMPPKQPTSASIPTGTPSRTVLTDEPKLAGTVMDDIPTPGASNIQINPNQYPNGIGPTLSGNTPITTYGYVGEVQIGSNTYMKLTDDKWYDVTKADLNQPQVTDSALIQRLDSAQSAGTYKYKSPFGTISGGWGHLAQGLQWSLLVVGAIQLIGGIAGLSKELTTSLTYAAFGGIMSAKLFAALGPNGGLKMFGNTYGRGLTSGSGMGQLGIGLGVAALIFVLTYKKVDTKTVNFQCLPWEAPSGGARCEECNKNPFTPCTEYRCKSLGQACELLNPNTANAQCAWVSRNDVESPKIIPSRTALYPEGLIYEDDKVNIRPPAIGTKIKPSGATCLPAFTPLQFGFTTNEPAQCKINYAHTDNFENMEYYVGDNNYYSYNHTQKLRLPGPVNDTSSPLYIKNDGTMGLYVRCQDANGNENVDEYVFTFCVDKGPDTTPPIMEEFSLPSGSFVTYNRDNVPIELYVNEPAQCKWSMADKNYDDMENTMKCYNNPDQFNPDLQYTCAGNVTGVKNMEDNKYYFRCEDTSGNTNTKSKELLLKGSQPLNIIKALPNETITGSTEYVSVDLEIETSDGAEEGKAICYFSQTGAANSYIQMFETDSFLHKQTLSLRNDNYKYYFRCIDYGGNSAEENVSFSVFVDKDAPIVTRTYKEDALKIVTNEDAICTYSLSSCDFDTKDGKEMIYSNPDELNKLYAEWKAGQKYYIRCQDKYGNEPSPNYCSIVVSSIELSKEEESNS